MITIASESVLKALMAVRYEPKLIEILMWIEHQTGYINITSGWRDAKVYQDDSGIHLTQPCRAVDISSKDYKNPDEIVENVNRAWEYDYERPSKKCIVYHDVGYGLHFHIQVHKNTRLREGYNL